MERNLKDACNIADLDSIEFILKLGLQIKGSCIVSFGPLARAVHVIAVCLLEKAELLHVYDQDLRVGQRDRYRNVDV